MRIVLLCGLRDPARAQRFAVDPVDHRRSARRRKGEAHGVFGKAIDWRHRSGPEAIRAETLDEPVQRWDGDRLGAVDDHAQRRKVQPLQP